MANRWYTEFKQLRQKKSGKVGTSPRGETGRPSMPGEKTANWPDLSPHWGGSFNRATKADVVKIRAKKSGID